MWDGCCTKARIYEPFFTTKGVGEGTGLGLATIYGIMEQNGGHIHVTSEPGAGTTFQLYFPKFEEDKADLPEAENNDFSLEGTETILLVEDEPQVLAIAKQGLSMHGYTVITASNGKEALKLLASEKVVIDLMLTDVIMPDMNGKELDRAIREHLPGLRTIFMSGYTADVIARRGIIESKVNFISKTVFH